MNRSRTYSFTRQRLWPACVWLVGCGGLAVEGSEPGKFTGSEPADGALNVRLNAPVVFVFNESVSDESLKARDDNGPCEDLQIQVSDDGFVTCVGGTVSLVPDAERHKIQFKSTNDWDAETRYEGKATKGLSFEEFLPLEADAAFVFTTAKAVEPAGGDHEGDSPTRSPGP